MVETTSVIAIIIGFVVAAIVLSIGVTILGATSQGFDCNTLDGSNTKLSYTVDNTGTAAGTAKTAADKATADAALQKIADGYQATAGSVSADSGKYGSIAVPADSGWAATCFSNSTQVTSAYSIITIVTVVLAAAAILYVIRMF